MLMFNKLHLSGFCVFLLVILLFSGQDVIGSEPLSAAKPFAEHHLILQVSDNDPDKFRAVLSISNNLIKHYQGPDLVDIEIITFGPGVHLLSDDNSNLNKPAISALAKNGVRFYICENTLDSLERKTGRKMPVMKQGIAVPTGVAFLVEEIQKGYVAIHP